MSDSDPDYARLKEVLDRVAEEPGAARESLVREALANEPALRDRVLGMLRAEDQDPDFLEGGLPELLGFEATAVESSVRLSGTQVGPFTLRRVLGQGGMGTVYLAHQKEPVDRIVAVKLISTYASRTQRIRFERECRALARFAHPNVITMYQSGVSASGEPYAAMEYVDGLRISEWCRRHRTPFEQRLELFLGACLGVAHAHEKGILHRDIKPSNILVTEVDGRPTAKVIDFGITTALSPDGDDTDRLTRQQLLGTPAYMSPESVHLTDRESLDARSDVYSLGVVLLELVTGQTPHNAEDLPVVDWVNYLSTAEAPHAGEMFASLPEDQRLEFSAEVQTTPRMLDRELRSEISVILLKALALAPDDRYTSSRQFAEDLGRLLAGDAVLAHPPSRVYITRKLIQRHWLGLSAAALLIVILAGAVLVRSLEVARTRRALEESSAISAFLIDLMEHASPMRAAGDEVTLDDIISIAAAELDERFADRPLVHARLLHTLGKVYGERGRYDRSVELLQQAVGLMENTPRTSELRLVRVLFDLGNSLRRMLRIEEAESVLRRGMELCEAHVDEDPLLVADLATSLGNLYIVNTLYEKAARQHLRALELREANLPTDDLSIIAAKSNLTAALINSWQTAKALPYAEQVLARYEAGLSAGHPWIGVAHNNYGIILDLLGRKEEALPILRQALSDAGQRLGERHPDLAADWSNIATTLVELGRREEARDAIEMQVRILMPSLGPESPRTLRAQRRLAVWAYGEGDYETALADLESIASKLHETQGEGSVHTLSADLELIRTLIQLERFEEADQDLARVHPLLAQAVGPDHSIAFVGRLLEARSTGRQGAPQRAIEQLQAVLPQALTARHSRTAIIGEIYEELARQSLAMGDYQAAVRSARQALDHWTSRQTRLGIARSHGLLGDAYLAAGDVPRAREHFSEAVARNRNLYPVDHHLRVESEESRARLDAADIGP